MRNQENLTEEPVILEKLDRERAIITYEKCCMFHDFLIWSLEQRPVSFGDNLDEPAIIYRLKPCCNVVGESIHLCCDCDTTGPGTEVRPREQRT